MGRADGPVRLFVRPWHFDLAPATEVNLNGTVRGAYRAGRRTHISLEHQGAMLAAVLAQAGLPGDGDTIGLRTIGRFLFPERTGN